MTVNGFNGEYKFLSNFYGGALEFEGIQYPTVEHAYQAAKSELPEVRKYIASRVTPGAAKTLGRAVALRPDWEDVKLSIMKTLLRKKFYDPVLKAALLHTYEQELCELNYWHDQYWGSCTCLRHQMTPGKNHLGKLLMELRSELQGIERTPASKPLEVSS